MKKFNVTKLERILEKSHQKHLVLIDVGDRCRDARSAANKAKIILDEFVYENGFVIQPGAEDKYQPSIIAHYKGLKAECDRLNLKLDRLQAEHDRAHDAWSKLSVISSRLSEYARENLGWKEDAA